MISTFMRIDWLALRRDRIALGLTFVLPLVFFSIFAAIFGGMGDVGAGRGGALRVVVVDEDGTDTSRRFIAAIEAQEALRVERDAPPAEGQTGGVPHSRETARARVRGGGAPAAVIVPEGFSDRFGDFGAGGAAVELLYDAANPLAQNAIGGLLQGAAFTAAPDVLMERGMGWLETVSGEGMTPGQREAYEKLKLHLRGEAPWDPAAAEERAGGDAGAGMQGLVRVEATPARDEPAGPRRSSIISYYAAGIGVMFLLFSMTGAAGSILEEEESGTLERLLTSNVRITSILLGKWAFFGAMGLLQLALMFLWGWAVFGLELFTPSRIAGFVAMSIVTAAAASAFGIVLAAVCRTRAQLNGVATVVVLVMSALGGSMVPRFAMPKFMDSLALLTFNGWALDGYLKVFWYDQPGVGPGGTVAALWPQLAVLGALAALFLALARRLARRWEVV